MGTLARSIDLNDGGPLVCGYSHRERQRVRVLGGGGGGHRNGYHDVSPWNE